MGLEIAVLEAMEPSLGGKEEAGAWGAEQGRADLRETLFRYCAGRRTTEEEPGAGQDMSTCFQPLGLSGCSSSRYEGGPTMTMWVANHTDTTLEDQQMFKYPTQQK